MSSGDITLTYEPYYRLRQKPFSLFADPRFLYKSAVHAPAFHDLLEAIRRREGLIVVTGDIGTGKTTLCRSALEHLDRKTFSAFVTDPFMSREDLLKTLLIDFGVMSVDELRGGPLHSASRLELSYVLYEFLDSLVPLQAVAVVVIDEAQNLSVPLLEEVRILSDLVGREKLLQVVLVGQIELAENLKLPQMRQLDQRVTMRCTLTPLSEQEVGRYIAHRLSVAGGGNTAVTFTPEALGAVYQISRGVPRLINLLCDRSLHESWRAQVSSVHSAAVCAAAAHLGLSSAEPASRTDGPSTIVRAAVEPSIAQIAEAFETLPPLGEQPLVEERSRPSDQPLSEFPSEVEINDHVKRRHWTSSIFAVALASVTAVLAGGLTLYFLADGYDLQRVQPPPVPAKPEHVQFLRASPSGVAHTSTASAVPQKAGQVDAAAPKAVDGPTPDDLAYGIQIASFRDADRAQRLIEEMASIGVSARAVERDRSAAGLWYQVFADGYSSIEMAQSDLDRIRQRPMYSDAKVVRYRRQS